MKIATVVAAAALVFSTAAAGYAIQGDRYKVITNPQATKCWNAANRVIAEQSSARLIEVDTRNRMEGSLVDMKFFVTSEFGTTTNGHFRCEFRDGRNQRRMTAMSLNSYRYSNDQVVMLNALADL